MWRGSQRVFLLNAGRGGLREHGLWFLALIEKEKEPGREKRVARYETIIAPQATAFLCLLYGQLCRGVLF